MIAEEIVGYDFTHVAVATGATWRSDGLGRFHASGVFAEALTPDDLLASRTRRSSASCGRSAFPT